MKPLPVHISKLRLRLRATKAFSPELVDLLKEIDEIGESAEQLIPDLIGMMKREVYVPPIPLVHIISRLRSPGLLSAALEQYEGEWPLSTFRLEEWEATYDWLHQNLKLFLSELSPRIEAIRRRLEECSSRRHQ